MTTDRHKQPGRLIRLTPPDLWERLGEKVGTRERSRVISELVRRFVAGKPMPTVAEVAKDPDKRAEGHSA